MSMIVSGSATAQRDLLLNEYVREGLGHRTRDLLLNEYVREWFGHCTRVR